MKLFGKRKGSVPSEADIQRKNICYENIKRKVSEKSGVTNFIEKDGYTAFSGTAEDPRLILVFDLEKDGDKYFLYANINDNTTFYERDHESTEAFENDVVEELLLLMGRTVKTVYEKKKHAYIKISRYYLNGDGEWIYIDEFVTDFPLVRLFITKDSVKEEIQTY